jgi:hypothetical protein
MKTLLMILGALVLLSIAVPLVLTLFGFAISLLWWGVKLAIVAAVVMFIIGLVRKTMV